MDKINFENLPSTNTPVNASNLNLMQSNMEKAINQNIKAEYGNGAIDPNNTIFPLILTKHLNGPKGEEKFYYIHTIFYGSIATTSNRSQIAIGYNTNEIYTRTYNNGTWSDWLGYQTETVTNDNGTAIKFPDGKMICYFNKTVTDQAINTALGSIYKGNRVWDYPEPFIEMPVVTCGQFKWSTGSSWGGVAGTNHLRATLTGYDCYSRAAGTSCTIQATAIGRWK